MEIFTTRAALAMRLDQLRNQPCSIGFVATMGALHAGHLELVRRSRALCNYTVCSIFVNPTQFNNPDDLEKYPRPEQEDIRKLEAADCDILFMPAVHEMYPGNETWQLDLGHLETILEGKFRPGHYQGVTQIVYKLFDAIKPDVAFFGQKDYQQVKVVEKMTERLHLPVRIEMCPIVREADGLAMSSRNLHLSPSQRQQALALFRALEAVRRDFGSKSLAGITAQAVRDLEGSEGIRLEYFELADTVSLLPATGETPHVIALVAAWVGTTRLIDNTILS